jgi:hypothetical protein
VYRAQYVRGIDQLAEWLRPDARMDELDVAGIGDPGEAYVRANSKALRVTAPNDRAAEGR